MNKWSEEDINFLKKNYLSMNAREISKKLNRTKEAVHWKAHKLGISKMPEWTDSELAFLEEYYESKGPKWISDKIRRSLKAVKFKGQQLGLNRKEAWRKKKVKKSFKSNEVE